MAEGLVQWLSDPATLIGLGTVAALAAYYLFTRPKPLKSRIPLERQSVELPVSPLVWVLCSDGCWTRCECGL